MVIANEYTVMAIMKDNNKNYVSPEMELIEFKVSDIITTSGDVPTGENELPFIPIG